MWLIWKYSVEVPRDIAFALLEASYKTGNKTFFLNVLTYFQEVLAKREPTVEISPLQATLQGYLAKYREQWGIIVDMEGI